MKQTFGSLWGLVVVALLVTVNVNGAEEHWRIRGEAIGSVGVWGTSYGVEPGWNAAGGGGVVVGSVGLGGEIGLFRNSPYLSANGTYHLPTSGHLVPFFTGGFTFMSADSPFLANFGGGVSYWLSKTTGLRFEIRDHLFIDRPDRHLLALRAGLVFRFP